MSLRENFFELTPKRKQAGFKWNGLTIIIESKILARYLFLATREYIYVDGQLVVEGGGFRFRERGTGEFTDSQGDNHQIEYEARGGLFLTWVPCSISIDGEIVYKGACPIRGLYKAITAGIFCGIIFMMFLLSFIF